jgi:hypothetical protein
MFTAEAVHWTGRDATRVANNLIELTVLADGGHLAELRFRDKLGLPTQNVLWDAPWMAGGSGIDEAERLAKTAGFTGHALCLDYFGPPSAEEAARGCPIHGEAGARRWEAHSARCGTESGLAWTVALPLAQLRFERTLCAPEGQSVVYVEETVANERSTDHACHWVQHVTFSPPFLQEGVSRLAASATRGQTAPMPYEGDGLLALDQEFEWPDAPRFGEAGKRVDLSRPFSEGGRGCLACVQMDPRRDFEFLLATNRELQLGVGYCFRRRDFPWMAIWEENCARPDSPWNGTTQARGMEFGTTPLPLGREAMRHRGDLFGTPTDCAIPAHGERKARYLIFLFTIPPTMEAVEAAEIEDNGIALRGDGEARSFSVAAEGCKRFLRGDGGVWPGASVTA